MPGVSYGQLLWLVRIVLFVCVTLHITAAIQLTRMSRAARPIGYATKKDIETTWAARTMRGPGRSFLGRLHCFPSFPPDGRSRRVSRGPIQGSRCLPERGGRVHGIADCSLLHHRDGRPVLPPRPRNLEPAANPWLEHCSKRSDAADDFAGHRDRRVPGIHLRSRCRNDRLDTLKERVVPTETKIALTLPSPAKRARVRKNKSRALWSEKFPRPFGWRGLG